MPVQEPAFTGDNAPTEGRWVAAAATPLLAALLGAAVGVGGGVYVADRQSKTSRRDVARQIEASRVGRISDARAETYGEFVSAVDRHLEKIGDRSENAIRQADEEIVAALRLVELRGSRAASVEAAAIFSRARRLTNAAVVAIQARRRDQILTESFSHSRRHSIDSSAGYSQSFAGNRWKYRRPA